MSAGARETADAPFSYACHRCLKCCRDKLIQVNPYEVARLARRIGISTTAFIADHLEDGVFLRRVPDGACEFLGPQGCTVHPDRPLVCRLYPLGRHVAADGQITYSHHEPHPETQGVYGRDGTIADFLAQQQVGPFVGAADRYLEILQRLFDAWREAPPDAEAGPAEPPGGAASERTERVWWLHDLDQAVADYCAKRGLAEPADLEARLDLHLQAIAAWLEEIRREPPSGEVVSK